MVAISFFFVPTTVSLLMHDALTLVKAKKSSSRRTTFELCVECWRRWRVALRSYSWGGLWGKKVAWYCLASTCTAIAARPRNWTWLIKLYVDHTSYERTLRSAAPNANYVNLQVPLNISPQNLEPCFLQTLFFNYQFVLLWAYDFDGYRITGVTECSKAH